MVQACILCDDDGKTHSEQRRQQAYDGEAARKHRVSLFVGEGSFPKLVQGSRSDAGENATMRLNLF